MKNELVDGIKKSIEKGKKFDQGKPNYVGIFKFLEFDFLKDVSDVMEIGAKKYGYLNWQNELDPERIESALIRHLKSYLNGKKLDDESKKSHLAHIVCNCMFLWFYDKQVGKN